MKSQMDISKLYDPDSEYLYISNSGIQHLASIYDSSNPQKNVEWTTDFTIELPIKVKKAGKGFILIIMLKTNFYIYLRIRATLYFS